MVLFMGLSQEMHYSDLVKYFTQFLPTSLVFSPVYVSLLNCEAILKSLALYTVRTQTSMTMTLTIDFQGCYDKDAVA